MRVEGIIRLIRSGDYVFSTLERDYVFDFTKLTREQVLEAFIKTCFWECEVQDDKVVKLVKTSIPKKLREDEENARGQ